MFSLSCFRVLIPSSFHQFLHTRPIIVTMAPPINTRSRYTSSKQPITIRVTVEEIIVQTWPQREIKANSKTQTRPQQKRESPLSSQSRRLKSKSEDIDKEKSGVSSSEVESFNDYIASGSRPSRVKWPTIKYFSFILLPDLREKRVTVVPGIGSAAAERLSSLGKTSVC